MSNETDKTTVFEGVNPAELPPEKAVGSAGVPSLQMPRPPEEPDPTKNVELAKKKPKATTKDMLAHLYEWTINRVGYQAQATLLQEHYAKSVHGIDLREGKDG